ncbi:MAG TPA: hypothetical protein VFQ92_19840 [Blastocatellia bacterium]|nr:hypothetical protein [Blastocatellia bacterium]
MTDLRITKRGLIESEARFRGVVAALRPNHFSGAIGTGLSDWIESRWGLPRGRLMTPVRKNLLRKRAARLPLRSSRGRAFAPSSYRLFSTLRLSITLRPRVSSSFTKDATRPVCDNPAWPWVRYAFDRERLFTDRSLLMSRATSLLPSGRSLKVMTLLSGKEVSHAPGSMATQLTDQVKARNLPNAFLPPVIIRSPGDTARLAHLFNVRSLSPVSFQSVFNSRINPRAEMIVSLRSTQHSSHRAWRTLMLKETASAPLAIELAGQSQWRSVPLTTLGSGSGQPSARAEFTTLHLTFLAPKTANTEAPAQRSSRFGPAPPLFYARRDAGPARALASALHDFKKSLSEIKATPPAQLPQVDQLTRQVYDQLKRELRIEKERRGL